MREEGPWSLSEPIGWRTKGRPRWRKADEEEGAWREKKRYARMIFERTLSSKTGVGTPSGAEGQKDSRPTTTEKPAFLHAIQGHC